MAFAAARVRKARKFAGLPGYVTLDASASRRAPYTRRDMIGYLFRDIDAADIFAFSTDLTGTNIPPVTQTTDCCFKRREIQ